MIAESITVTTVGLGDEADDQLLRMIADVGGGRYHKVTDPNALRRIFTRETEMVARQAAVEEWFPVTQVSPADFLRGLEGLGANSQRSGDRLPRTDEGCRSRTSKHTARHSRNQTFDARDAMRAESLRLA
jgi:hypothetical protein